MQHIRRESNIISGCMAKLAFDTTQNLTVFEEISRELLTTSPIVE
ncbi:hypothetical protein Godav_003260, partial [Gossypium davidsonii]|nr:hypothetical protein [Gossypium davidsonii]